MLTVIWVFGSMLLMFLIHFLLPLGFTTKGKFVVVVSSGLLALGGLAAVAIIPLWQTLLILLAFSFFAAYLMDSRLGKVIYMTKEQFIEENEIPDSDASFILTKQLEKTSDLELMDLSELEITASSSVINQEEDAFSTESLEEDISFLQDRGIERNPEEDLEDGEIEVGYLSDIESLLEESNQETVKINEEEVDSLDEEGWLDELAELTMVDDEEKSINEESHLEDFELEELFVDKEAVAARATDNDESKPMKVLELQK